MQSLRLLRDHPAFRRLWLAGTISLVGDWLTFVAIALLAVDRGGGALALALVFAAHALPQALFSPVAGVVADRFDRRRVLLAAPLAQATLTILMAVTALRGAVPLVQVLVLVRSALSAFVAPAEAAALRRTVPEADLLRANGFVASTWSVTYIAGMALGGALATLGPATAMALDAVTFLAAAALLHGLPAMRPEGAPAPLPSAGVLRAVAADLAAAYRHASARPDLFRKVFAKAPIAFAGGAGWVVINLVAAQVHPLGSAAISLGVLQAVRGAGTGIGPAVAAALPRRLEPLSEHGAAALAFVAIAAFPLAALSSILFVIALVWGMGTGANWVMATAGVQRLSPDRFIGRLASIDELAATSAIVAGALTGAEAVERTGSTTIAAWTGVAVGLAGWLWLSRPRAAALDGATGVSI